MAKSGLCRSSITSNQNKSWQRKTLNVNHLRNFGNSASTSRWIATQLLPNLLDIKRKLRKKKNVKKSGIFKITTPLFCTLIFLFTTLIRHRDLHSHLWVTSWRRLEKIRTAILLNKRLTIYSAIIMPRPAVSFFMLSQYPPLPPPPTHYFDGLAAQSAK